MAKVCLDSLLKYPLPLTVNQCCVGDELNPTHTISMLDKDKPAGHMPTCAGVQKKGQTMENKRGVGTPSAYQRHSKRGAHMGRSAAAEWRTSGHKLGAGWELLTPPSTPHPPAASSSTTFFLSNLSFVFLDFIFASCRQLWPQTLDSNPQQPVIRHAPPPTKKKYKINDIQMQKGKKQKLEYNYPILQTSII